MITRKLRTWLLIAVLGVVATTLSACFGGANAALTGASWPGITIGDEAIYVASGPQVFAVDPASHNARWAFPADPGRNQNFYASPAVTDDLVIVADYSNSLFALDITTGSQLWSFQSENSSRFVGGAAVGDDAVYAGTVNGVLYALDIASGDVLWRFSAERDIWSTPLLADDTLYMTSLDKHLYAIDATSGEQLWQFPAPNDSRFSEKDVGALVGTPTLHEGILYFGSFSNKLFALDTATQQLAWEPYETSNWIWGSPLVDEENGLLIGGDLDGNVFGLDLVSGEPVWAFEADGPVVSTPVIGTHDDARVVFVTSADTNLYILDPADGSQAANPVSVEAEFKAFLSGANIRPVPLYAPPVLYNDVILLGAHEGPSPLYALDRNTLLEQWHFEPPSS